ncbi:MAG: hypothetical protein U1E70_26040 [Acetobacteraceae bacterium]|nr:hypothetical protein [Pseudomonadota bacterium]
MARVLGLLFALAVIGSAAGCAGGFPPEGNGRGILNYGDPMMGGGG